MPKLDIDMFDEAPSIGDKVQVTGKVKSINEDSGEVEVSYDEVKIVNNSPKHKKKTNRYNDNFVEGDMPTQMDPNTQSLDEALSQSFPNTQ